MEDDEDDGPPALPGGKFYMTPAGHERLRAELAAAADRAASGGRDRGVGGEQRGSQRERRLQGGQAPPARDRSTAAIPDERIAHAEVVDPAEQAQRDRVFFGATVTYANERDEEVK